MLKKIGIIVTVIVIIAASIFVYSNKNRVNQQISPIIDIKTISGKTYIESGVIENGNEWDPNVMKIGQPIQSKTGVTITVSTNGPAVRAMNPEELKEFQKKIQGK